MKENLQNEKSKNEKILNQKNDQIERQKRHIDEIKMSYK